MFWKIVRNPVHKSFTSVVLQWYKGFLWVSIFICALKKTNQKTTKQNNNKKTPPKTKPNQNKPTKNKTHRKQNKKQAPKPTKPHNCTFSIKIYWVKDCIIYLWRVGEISSEFQHQRSLFSSDSLVTFTLIFYFMDFHKLLRKQS